MNFARLNMVSILLGIIVIAASSCMNGDELRQYLYDIPISKQTFGTLRDGIYEASYSVTVPEGAYAQNPKLTVRIVVADGRATEINIIDPAHLNEKAAWQNLIHTILQQQNLSVDAVSGATISSTAFLKAIDIAVAQSR